MRENSARITSIDALRAVVLLGILLVHTVGLFGFHNPNNSFSYFTSIDWQSLSIINIFLNGRCNIVFSILFGVSFHLILRKPQYSSLKFIWRCFLLFVLGLLIKFFYTFDALMWYGIMGIILVLFRKAKPLTLFLSFSITFLLSIYLAKFSLGNLLLSANATNRYGLTDSIVQVVSYPLASSVTDYLRAVLNGGILRTLSYFILGYFFAKAGFVDDISKHSNIKSVSLVALLYLPLFVIYYVADYNQSIVKAFMYLFGGLFYTILFLFLYYKCSRYISFSWLESYGKLGLTNYCMQNICGVIFMSTLFIPYQFQFTTILCCSLIFYLLQIAFSVIWLRYYKYGPFEWFWRCLTNMKYVSNRRLLK